MDYDKEYHIDIARGEMPELVLLPGDPQRSKAIAERFFRNPWQVAQKREYWSYRGEYDGVPVGVCSTGIGCPSAAIALEELIRVGCTTFIRVGTAGAVGPNLKAGDLAILAGAVRDDGTSRQYVPIEYPAVADVGLVRALTDSATKRAVRHRVGIGHTKDSFYSEFPDMTTDPVAMKKRWDTWKRAGVIATEMESAVLFVLGSLRGAHVATACVIVGEPVEKEAKITHKPELDQLIPVALDALVSFSRKKA